MATSAVSQREIVRFEPGKPETVRLKYATGREISGRGGPRFMFSTVEDRVFFLDPPEARRIADAGIEPGEPIEIVKRRNPEGGYRWDMRRPGRTEVSEPRPESHAEPEPGGGEDTPVITPLAAKLCSSMCALIDAMSEAKAYAARRRIDLTNEDLRALAATAFITETKGASR